MDIWEGEFKKENHLMIEEILLDKLDWNLRIVTSCEVLQKIENVVVELAENSNLRNNTEARGLPSLAEIMLSKDFKEKASMFTQIALIGKNCLIINLDYGLSRYSPFICAIAAQMLVLNKYYSRTNYFLYNNIFDSIFKDEDYISELKSFLSIASSMLGIDIPAQEEQWEKASTGEIPAKEDTESDSDKVSCMSERSDHSTSYYTTPSKSSISTSPVKRFAGEETQDSKSMNFEAKKKKRIHAKKRSIICKRRL